jgi:DNA-binding IclR family transcriptional regulator
MPAQTLSEEILSLLEKESLLTPPEIAKKLKRDKAKVSGYLEAMVDHGDLGVKKAGNSKVYFLNEKGK